MRFFIIRGIQQSYIIQNLRFRLSTTNFRKRQKFVCKPKVGKFSIQMSICLISLKLQTKLEQYLAPFVFISLCAIRELGTLCCINNIVAHVETMEHCYLRCKVSHIMHLRKIPMLDDDCDL